MKVKTKKEYRKRRHLRLRKVVKGTAERPRLAVSQSNNHLTAQLIDDQAGVTLAYVSTESPAFRESAGNVTIEKAKAVGEKLAELAKEKGIQTAVYDRGGFTYGSRNRALADAVREAGIVM